jgi:hypothetical protein
MPSKCRARAWLPGERDEKLLKKTTCAPRGNPARNGPTVAPAVAGIGEDRDFGELATGRSAEIAVPKLLARNH